MAVSYAVAAAHLGRPVVAHLADGRRVYGIVRRVHHDGLFIEPYRSIATSYASSNEKAIIDTPESLGGNGKLKVEEAFWPGFWGWWWIPFIILLALTPLFFWW